MSKTIRSCLSVVLILSIQTPLYLFVKANNIPIQWSGFLLDDSGNGISNGQVQIWQTDSNGVYDHPKFPGFADATLDPHFQYYGTAATDAMTGQFEFRTVRPGIYSQRPITHIHVRVFVEGKVQLTTQLYFADENPNYPAALILDLQEEEGHRPEENTRYSTAKNITVDLGGGGSVEATPSQQAGPFYPVDDFFHVDSDLYHVSDDHPTTSSAPATPTQAPTTLCAFLSAASSLILKQTTHG